MGVFRQEVKWRDKVYLAFVLDWSDKSIHEPCMQDLTASQSQTSLHIDQGANALLLIFRRRVEITVFHEQVDHIIMRKANTSGQ